MFPVIYCDLCTDDGKGTGFWNEINSVIDRALIESGYSLGTMHLPVCSIIKRLFFDDVCSCDRGGQVIPH